jgi:putative heme-binding domain-containing protein
LTTALATAPRRLAGSIALALAGARTGGEALLSAIAAGKASPQLLQDKAVRGRLAQSKVPDLDARLAKLTAGLPSPDQRIAELLHARAKGYATATADAKLGALVFTKHCAGCHAVANVGGKVGPQLDGIGNRGIERLLEDVLDPNRNVDATFRASTLNLTNGKVLTGLVLREEGQIVILADAHGQEVRVPKAEIEEQTLSALSPMPANWSEQITAGEFYHLLAYLLELRAGERR